jgi:hypothetical protein
MPAKAGIQEYKKRRTPAFAGLQLFARPSTLSGEIFPRFWGIFHHLTDPKAPQFFADRYKIPSSFPIVVVIGIILIVMAYPLLSESQSGRGGKKWDIG